LLPIGHWLALCAALTGGIRRVKRSCGRFPDSNSNVERPVSRIFLTLSMAATAILAFAFFLGLGIDDPKAHEAQSSVSNHMLCGVGALICVTLVHAIVFTYFMGTGRWLEETSRAYHLKEDWYATSKKLKYRVLPGITGAFLLLLITMIFGALADPASSTGSGFKGLAGLPPDTLHLTLAIVTITANLLVNLHEFRSIERNGEVIEEVMNEVRRIRTERGLAV